MFDRSPDEDQCLATYWTMTVADAVPPGVADTSSRDTNALLFGSVARTVTVQLPPGARGAVQLFVNTWKATELAPSVETIAIEAAGTPLASGPALVTVKSWVGQSGSGAGWQLLKLP